MVNRVVKVVDTVESWRDALQAFDDHLRNGGGIGFDVQELSKSRQSDFMNVIHVKGVLLSGYKRK